MNNQKQLIASVGREIDFFKANAMARRMKLIESRRISLVLDVGANVGQYARALRRAGYTRRIASFEPLASASAQLRRKAKTDPLWSVHQLALGETDGEQTLNVSGDSRSSSILKMLPAHTRLAPYFATVGKEKVSVARLDSVFDEVARPRDRVFLKVDVQGFEAQVLAGAQKSLQRIQGIQIEMSLVPLYQGEMTLPGMMEQLSKLGFSLMSLEYGFCDPKTGRMLQVDGIFFRDRPR